MAKRIKKPAVKPELREEWVRRNEDGESPPDIAHRDGYDVRTVRKYIELAKQEIEVKEARATVLRNAMEKHYEDMRKYAEMLDSKFFGTGRTEPLKDAEFIEISLRQHLPRSPIWNYLYKLPDLENENKERQQKLYERIGETIKTNPILTRVERETNNTVNTAVIEALKFQVDGWSEGIVRMNLKRDLLSESVGEGYVNLHYGAFYIIDRINQRKAGESIPLIRTTLEELETRIRSSDDMLALGKIITEIRRMKRKLKEELAVIRMRRIVPGRCKYCPL